VKIGCGGSPPKKGLFKVGSFFSSLDCSMGSHFPWKSVANTGFYAGGLFCVVSGSR
jgi:hypothetical protein